MSKGTVISRAARDANLLIRCHTPRGVVSRRHWQLRPRLRRNDFLGQTSPMPFLARLDATQCTLRTAPSHTMGGTARHSARHTHAEGISSPRSPRSSPSRRTSLLARSASRCQKLSAVSGGPTAWFCWGKGNTRRCHTSGHRSREGRQRGTVYARQRCGEGQNRTADTAIFSRVLCQLSYLASTAEDSNGRP
jgi:hypothetical protein